jgi:hypothetical protein
MRGLWVAGDASSTAEELNGSACLLTVGPTSNNARRAAAELLSIYDPGVEHRT